MVGAVKNPPIVPPFAESPPTVRMANATRSLTSTIDLTRSMMLTAANMAIVERPKITSPVVGTVLWLLMIAGLLAFVVGLTVLVVLAVCYGIIGAGEANPGAVPEWLIERVRGALPSLHTVAYYAMLGSTLYGFASFLWFKYESAYWFGPWASYSLFLGVPMVLLAMKHFEPQLAAWVALPGGELPAWVAYIAKYYSFGWYLLLVSLAATAYRTEAHERIGHALTRMWVLALLCYVPYGYVLFVGESQLLDAALTTYVGDLQLILWVLLPLRR